MIEDYIKIDGTYINQIRRQKKIKMKELAEICNYTVSYISQIESKKIITTTETLEYILSKLGIDIKELKSIKSAIDIIINEFCYYLLNIDFENAENTYRKIKKFQNQIEKYYLNIELEKAKEILDICKKTRRTESTIVRSNFNYNITLDRLYIMYMNLFKYWNNAFENSIISLSDIKNHLRDDDYGLYFYVLSILHIQNNNYIDSFECMKLSQSFFLKKSLINGYIKTEILYAFLIYKNHKYIDAIEKCDNILEINHSESLKKEITNLKCWILIKNGEYNLANQIISNIDIMKNSESEFIYELSCVLLNINIKIHYKILVYLEDAIKNSNMVNLVKYYKSNKKNLNYEFRFWLINILIRYYEESNKYKHLIEMLNEKLNLSGIE